jgi:hypothetical protein
VRNKCLPSLRGKGRGSWVALGLAAALLVFATTPTRAGSLNIVVESSTAAPGTIGHFDIDLVNNSASAVTVAAFSVDVLLSDISNVSFTSMTNSTTAPYIFSITGSFGFLSQVLPMEVSGNDLAQGSGQVVNPGDTWGLANVTYAVSPSAPLGTVVGVSLEPAPVFLPSGGTSLSDPTGAPIPFDSVNGTITVPSSAVPEPSTAILLSTSGLILLLGRRFSCRG